MSYSKEKRSSIRILAGSEDAISLHRILAHKKNLASEKEVIIFQTFGVVDQLDIAIRVHRPPINLR